MAYFPDARTSQSCHYLPTQRKGPKAPFLATFNFSRQQMSLLFLILVIVSVLDFVAVLEDRAIGTEYRHVLLTVSADRRDYVQGVALIVLVNLVRIVRPSNLFSS